MFFVVQVILALTLQATLITCVIKNDDTFYPQLFLDEALHDE